MYNIYNSRTFLLSITNGKPLENIKKIDQPKTLSFPLKNDKYSNKCNKYRFRKKHKI